jgi:hypothetical protein
MANTINERIKKRLASVGRTVSYREAEEIAKELGVTVDRVYNQTAATGQAAKAGAAAANAGYAPTSQLKVSNPISPGYISAAVKNATATSPGGFNLSAGNESPGNSPGLIGSNPGVQPANAQPANAQPANAEPANAQPVPGFDWDAWNAQMAQQQAAIWASMDAMNSQFLQQQQAWMESQKVAQQQLPVRGINSFGSLGSSPDKAPVKRQKAKKRSASTTNPALGIGSGGSGSGVSLGGASSGNTLGVG